MKICEIRTKSRKKLDKTIASSLNILYNVKGLTPRAEQFVFLWACAVQSYTVGCLLNPSHCTVFCSARCAQ